MIYFSKIIEPDELPSVCEWRLKGKVNNIGIGLSDEAACALYAALGAYLDRSGIEKYRVELIDKNQTS